ncbi:MAG: hypothetical protein QXP60_03670 [Nitrososphaerota archaeon]
MPLETLIKVIKDNPNRYIPVIIGSPINYKKAGFYDDFFEVCQRIYGQYPISLPYILLRIKGSLILRMYASHEKIPPGPRWMEETLQKFPKFDLKYILNKELKSIFDENKEQLFHIACISRLSEEDIKVSMATRLCSLRIFEYNGFANIALNIYNKTKDFKLLDSLISIYYYYLIHPIKFLGAFQNYTINDLKAMAFLRAISLKGSDILNLRDRFRMIVNSPAARTFITLPSYKMSTFLEKSTDIKTLNKIYEIAERHKKETKELANYRKMIAEGNLNDALLSFKKMELVYKQISDEIKGWKRREKIAEGSIEAGAIILSEILTILSNIHQDGN